MSLFQSRLGVANSRRKNAVSYASIVLRLPAGCPIYQEQLVHSTANDEGAGAPSAEWCGTADADFSASSVIREISAHDHIFGRRNISGSPNYNFNQLIFQL
jgi:hypothetical protein